MTSYALWIDGFDASRVSPLGYAPPTWETLIDGGCGDLTTTLMLPSTAEHQALRKGVTVRLTLAGYGVHHGYLHSYDPHTGELVVQGQAWRNKLALDAGGNATRDVGVAITQAIARGWAVTNPTGVSGVASGDIESVQTIAELLSDYAAQTGRRWGVNGRGEVYMTPDPTSPKWLLAPGVAKFGPTGEGQATALAGRYMTSTRAYDTVVVGDFSGDEAPVDLTDRGIMTSAEAATILQGYLDLTASHLAWVNGADVTREQLTTRGGTPAALPDVVAGQMVRATGVPVMAAGGIWYDALIGKVVQTADEDTVYIEPLNTAPATLADVIAA